MIISVHQPNFMPWMPFFEKIKSSDVFVFLRHCQFEKNNYQNRFFYRDAWRTMSVNKGMEPIIDKRYLNPNIDWKRIKSNLQDKIEVLDMYDGCISDSLWETNSNIIIKTLELLGIKTRIEFDSPTVKRSNERLIDICKNLGATKYLAGSGGRNYMQLEAWDNAGIEVIFQELEDRHKIHMLDVIKP